MGRAVVIGLLLALLAAARVQAATVSVDCTAYGPHYEFCDDEARFVAAPGEINNVTVQFAGGIVGLTDTTAPVSAGAGCTQLDPHSVACRSITPNSYGIAAVIDAGDGDDHVSCPDGCKAAGGPGNDVLEGSIVSFDGGPGDDTLRATGGEFRNTLNGGGGHDTLIGGPYDDMFSDGDTPGNVDADTIIGGGGNDTLDDSMRTGPVVIDLAHGTTSDGDHLTAIQNAAGGSGNDRLIAGPHGAVLAGGAGADVLIGSVEGDLLLGGGGADRLIGGFGDDKLFVDSHSARADCGPGVDTVLVEGGYVASSCETVTGGFVLFDTATLQQHATGGHGAIADATLYCPNEPQPCSFSIQIQTLTGIVLGRSQARAANAVDVRLRCRLTAAGRARLSRAHHLAVKIIFSSNDRRYTVRTTLRNG